MKVCHVTSSHRRYDGRIFQKECISLSKKYDVVLLCSDTLENEIRDKVTILSAGIDNSTRKNRFFVIPRYLKKACKKIDADVYHFHDPELIGLAYLMHKKGKKVIFDSHEDNLNRIICKTWIPRYLKPIMKYCFLKKEKKCLRNLDAIITVTDHIYNRLKLINEHTYIITNYPIYTEISIPSKKESNIMCFAGTFEDQYNHENIIKAIEYLDVKYIIAGKPNADYMEHLKKLKGFKKVQCLGQVSKEECDNLYLKSNIGMVLISYNPNINYKKGSMGITKIFEYMQFGLPVIASDLEVWKDIVPNKCGISVDPDNVDQIKEAIQYLVNNPDKAKKMGQIGQKMVKEKYNWETQEKVLFDVYKKIEKGL